MFFPAVAGGILVGAVIVFAGVWLLKSWRVAGPVARSIIVFLLTVALGVASVSFFRALPSRFHAGLAAALPAFLACLFLLGVFRVWREKWTRRPDRWGVWLVRETAAALLVPLAIVAVGVSVLSTGAFFAAMQKGPQLGSSLPELGIVTAACWALVTVGGVWARGRTANSGAVSRRTSHQ